MAAVLHAGSAIKGSGGARPSSIPSSTSAYRPRSSAAFRTSPRQGLSSYLQLSSTTIIGAVSLPESGACILAYTHKYNQKKSGVLVAPCTTRLS